MKVLVNEFPHFDAEVLAFDTETSGLDHHSYRVWSVQVSDGGTTTVLLNLDDTATIEYLRDLFETRGLTMMAHNAAFDLKALWRLGVYPKRVVCTKVAEDLISAGLPSHVQGNSLKDVLKRYKLADLSKEERSDFYDGTFEARLLRLVGATDIPDKEFVRLRRESGCDTPEYPLDTGHGSLVEAWTEELINYAAQDVAYLHKLYEMQMDRMQRLGLEKVWRLEMSFVRAIAAMEWNGVRMKADDAEAFGLEMQKAADSLLTSPEFEKVGDLWHREALKVYEEKLAIKSNWEQRRDEAVNAAEESGNRRRFEALTKFYYSEPSRKAAMQRPSETLSASIRRWAKQPGGEVLLIVSDECRERVANIRAAFEEQRKREKIVSPKFPNRSSFNPDSPAQIKLALQGQGFEVESADRAALAELAEESPELATLLRYRNYRKLQQLLEVRKLVNRNTGRIHPYYKQVLVTGRIAARSPNLLQIPSKAEGAERFRALFVPSEGNVLLDADFSAAELRLAGYYSGDERLLEALTSAKDLHFRTVRLMFNLPDGLDDRLEDFRNGSELSAQDTNEVERLRRDFNIAFNIPTIREQTTLKGFVKQLRELIKTVTYGCVYGLSAMGICKRYNCSFEEAQGIINAFFGAYPALRTKMDWCGSYAVNNKKAPPTNLGRMRHFIIPRVPSTVEIQEKLRAQYDDEEQLRAAVRESAEEALKEHRKATSRVRRQAGNFPIQASNADATKLAALYLMERYPQPTSPVKLLMLVHDEVIMEAPKDMASEVKAEIENCMSRSFDVISGVAGSMPVTCKVSEFWEK